MRKITLITALVLFLFSLANAQFQRLAVIPGSGDKLMSVCIDYLSDVPAEGLAMSKVMSLGAQGTDYAERIGRDYKFTSNGGFSSVEFDKSGNSGLDKPFLVGENGAKNDLSAEHAKFINDRISHYRLKGLTDKHLQQLQDEVWKFDILNRLGYIRETGNSMADLQMAMNRFNADMGGQQALSQEHTLFETAEAIKAILHAKDQAVQGTHYLYVSKNRISGNYVVFDGFHRPVYKGHDKQILAALLDPKVAEGDDMFFLYDESMSDNNCKAFSTDMEIQMRLQHGKKVNVSEYNPLLFTPGVSHSIPNAEVTVKEIGSTYESTTTVVSSNGYMEVNSLLTARSTSRNAVTGFFARCKDYISTIQKNESLAAFLYRMKRQVQQAMGIQKKELTLIFKTEGIESKLSRNKAGTINEWAVVK